MAENERKIAYSYIRFSAKHQMRGSSLARQLERTREYCAKNGFQLDETLQFRDLGVSAFKGAHTEKALGAFLKAVEEGTIAKGSHLIVESLDRLDRRKVITAVKQFISILEQGINIITLTPEEIFSFETMDMVELIIAIVIMSRAHEESQRKSDRITDSWTRRIAKIHEKPLTSICPMWLKLVNDKFVPEPKMWNLVKRMFDMALEGTGSLSIARTFNKEKIPTLKGNSWQQSIILKVLKSRSVIGEFTTRTKYKNHPLGNKVVPNYFPPVIEKADFYKVQEYIESRIRKAKGNHGPSCTNLFTNLLFMKQDNSPLFIQARSNKKAGAALLWSMSGKLGGANANNTTISYPGFEIPFLMLFTQLKPKDLLIQNKVTDTEIIKQISELNSENGELMEKISDVKSQMKKSAKISPVLFDILSSSEERKAAIEVELELLKAKKPSDQPPLAQLQNLMMLLDTVEVASDPEKLMEMRLKVRNALYAIVDKIIVDIQPVPGEHRFHRKLEAIIHFKDGTLQRMNIKREVTYHHEPEGITAPRSHYFATITNIAKKEKDLKVVSKTIYAPAPPRVQNTQMIEKTTKTGAKVMVRKGNEKLLAKVN